MNSVLRIKHRLMQTEHKGFVIEGDEKFSHQTIAALDLLELKSPAGYELARDYIRRVSKTGKRSGMENFEDPPTFYVNDRTVRAGSEWYASCIVHDAEHAKKYQEYVRRHPALGPMLRFARILVGRGKKRDAWRFNTQPCWIWNNHHWLNM